MSKTTAHLMRKNDLPNGEIIGVFARPQQGMVLYPINEEDNPTEWAEKVAFETPSVVSDEDVDVNQNMTMIKMVAALTEKTERQAEDAYRAARRSR